MKRNLILTDGGMGDLVCQLVAVNYLINNNPKIKFEVWLPDYLHKFALHVLPSKSQVFPFSKANKHFKPDLNGRTTQWFEHGHTPMRTHPIDYGFHMLADRHIYNEAEKAYLKIRPKSINLKAFNLPKKYVALQVCYAEPVKTMKQETLAAIIHFIISRGYTPVFIGKTESTTGFKDMSVKAMPLKYDKSVGIDLVDKCDLLQSAAVIAGAAYFVGMDSGLVHLAGFTNTPIIAGYTLVDPIHAMPFTSRVYPIEPPLDTPNRYFQTKQSFYDGDYRTFPGWEDVKDSLSTDEFIAALIDFLP